MSTRSVGANERSSPDWLSSIFAARSAQPRVATTAAERARALAEWYSSSEVGKLAGGHLGLDRLTVLTPCRQRPAIGVGDVFIQGAEFDSVLAGA